jgi:hypothetical protein
MGTHQIVPFIAGLIAALIWTILLAPLLFSPFRLSIALNWRNRKNVRPNSWQRMLLLFLSFAGGVTILHFTDIYVRGKLYGNPVDQQMLEGVGQTLLENMGAGLFYALAMTLMSGKKDATD